MEHLGPQCVVFVGGSHNGIVKRLHPNQEVVGFVDVDIYRGSDKFVDYIIESNVESKLRERYYITKIVLFYDGNEGVRTYAAIEHNRLMMFIKNQLPEHLAASSKIIEKTLEHVRSSVRERSAELEYARLLIEKTLEQGDL